MVLVPDDHETLIAITRTITATTMTQVRSLMLGALAAVWVQCSLVDAHESRIARLHLARLPKKAQIRHMGRFRCYAVIGAILMALGTVSCSGSSPGTAATPVLGSGCVGCLYGHPSLAQAKTEFEKAVKADPENRYDWYDLGVIAQSSGDNRTAQADFLRAIAIDPKFESALYEEGLLRFRANDRAGAITYLSRAVTQNAKNSCAHWALGYALRPGGGPDAGQRATAQLRAALKIDPALIKGIGSPKVEPKNEVPGCN